LAKAIASGLRPGLRHDAPRETDAGPGTFAPDAKPSPFSDDGKGDIAALAKGGRTNFFGFLIRLVARVPFLFIASRLYGASALGRFASALVMVEFAGQVATLGQKRGLAQRLAETAWPETDEMADPPLHDVRPVHVQDPDAASQAVADALLVTMLLAGAMSVLIWLFPESMYPRGNFSLAERLLVLSVWMMAVGDIALAALAFRFDVATTVRARAVVEPWTLSITAGLAYFVYPEGGLALAYLASVGAATVVALVALLRAYGLPRHWRPRPLALLRLALRNMPLAGADAVEWGTRKLDVFLLRFFIGEAPLGIYYFAQQFASLPQKLKTSFEPVLGPVITRNVRAHNLPAIAAQVCQVGFWITAAQAGIALALAIPGAALMGLGGPDFVGGTYALFFLLAAEVVAATAVVSEAALIYLARLRNLWISLGTIVLQGVLTVGFIFAGAQAGLTAIGQSALAALAMAVSLALSSLLKSRLLARIVGAPINNWRWALIWAAVPALLVGMIARALPEWAELLLGLPAILAVYCLIIWKVGFGPEDRVLFRKHG
jgi:O-antigen/teichoic acid export membrane protein